jgi:hypothetical protein
MSTRNVLALALTLANTWQAVPARAADGPDDYWKGWRARQPFQ